MLQDVTPESFSQPVALQPLPASARLRRIVLPLRVALDCTAPQTHPHTSVAFTQFAARHSCSPRQHASTPAPHIRILPSPARTIRGLPGIQTDPPTQDPTRLAFFRRLPAHSVAATMLQRLETSRSRRKLFAASFALLLLLVYLLAALLSQSRSAEDFQAIRAINSVLFPEGLLSGHRMPDGHAVVRWLSDQARLPSPLTPPSFSYRQNRASTSPFTSPPPCLLNPQPARPRAALHHCTA